MEKQLSHLSHKQEQGVQLPPAQHFDKLSASYFDSSSHSRLRLSSAEVFEDSLSASIFIKEGERQASVAQWLEQLHHKQEVAGSSPATGIAGVA